MLVIDASVLVEALLVAALPGSGWQAPTCRLRS
jgi:hypothetical protein